MEYVSCVEVVLLQDAQSHDHQGQQGGDGGNVGAQSRGGTPGGVVVGARLPALAARTGSTDAHPLSKEYLLGLLCLTPHVRAK